MTAILDWLTGYRFVKVPPGDAFLVDAEPDAWWLIDVSDLPGRPATDYAHRQDPAKVQVNVGNPAAITSGSVGGQPVQNVTSVVRPTRVVIDDGYGNLSETWLPLPANVMVQGWPNSGQGDQHWIGVDSVAQRSYEAIGMDKPWWSGGRWSPQAVDVWNLETGELLEHHSVHAFAGGVPIAPLIVQPTECRLGIGHMGCVSLDDGGSSYVWPARHTDGLLLDGIPYGSVLRLRDNDRVPRDGQAGAIATMMMRRGVIVMDKNHQNHAAVKVTTSCTWKPADLNRLRRLTVADFDVVELPRGTT